MTTATTTIGALGHAPAVSSPHRTLFVVAALWNFGGAAMGLLFFDPLAAIAWTTPGPLHDPVAKQFAMMVFALVGVLGIGYVIVSIDPTRNRGLVLTAAIGKAAVLAVGAYYSWGVATAWLLVPAIGITFFTLAFSWFLVTTRDQGWY